MNNRKHKSDILYRTKDPELLRNLGKRETFFVNRIFKCNSKIEFVQISGEVSNELNEYISEKKKMKIRDDKSLIGH